RRARRDGRAPPGRHHAHLQDARDEGPRRQAAPLVLRARVGQGAGEAARGEGMLLVGENMWVYMPNLKRAIRVASRDSFQGGDFNNADALRVNYVADYTPRHADSGDPSLWTLELSAKS